MRLVFRLTLSGLLVASVAAGQALGDVARKQRTSDDHRKAKVFTNDDLPKAGVISVVGPEPGTSAGTPDASGKDASKAAAPAAADAAASPAKKSDASATTTSQDDEATWRQKFAKAREQLALDQREYDVAQRELNMAQQQFYTDPNQALHQQYDRGDINKRTADLNLLKAKMDADQAAVSSLEDELRKKGLPPGWARP